MTSVKAFFDKATWTLTYIVFDPSTKDAVVIDPVWDYDPAASQMSMESAFEVINYVQQEKLKVHMLLETHAHADHISGAQVLKQHWPTALIGIGAPIKKVQEVFKNVFNLDEKFKTDGSQFDLLLEEGKTYQAGSMSIKVIYTPGHTPACSSYLIDDCVFVGDTLFMPDYGTGRCDFPAGSASDLFNSIQKLYQLPDTTKVYTGHDYMPNGRKLKYESTIYEQKKSNIQMNETTTKDEFIKFRIQRDQTLKAPRLLLPSVQVNIDAGRLPAKENNGVSYLKIPLKTIP